MGPMALQPVNRRSVPEDVFEQIVAEVLSGQMQPGEPLPSERRLAEVLGVSRPAVREAIKRLTEAGLVEVRQGDSTTVRDFRKHAGLDLLPRLLLRAGELDVSVVRSILETRLHNGPKVAELAAEREYVGRAARGEAESDPVPHEHCVQHKDGTWRWLLISDAIACGLEQSMRILPSQSRVMNGHAGSTTRLTTERPMSSVSAMYSQYCTAAPPMGSAPMFSPAPRMASRLMMLARSSQ